MTDRVIINWILDYFYTIYFLCFSVFLAHGQRPGKAAKRLCGIGDVGLSSFVIGTLYQYPPVSSTGCDYICRKPYRRKQDNIDRSQKPYRPHGKSISASKNMMSVLRLIISSLHAYTRRVTRFCFVYSLVYMAYYNMTCTSKMCDQNHIHKTPF